jgi:hypothetical protein
LQRRAARLFSPALALMFLLLLRRLFLLLDLLPRLLLLLVVLCSSVLALWLLVLVLLLLSCKVDDWSRVCSGKEESGINSTLVCCHSKIGESCEYKNSFSLLTMPRKGIAALLLYHSRARVCIVEE